jgi:multicomponent Na+:H+ antiporter subunit F
MTVVLAIVTPVVVIVIAFFMTRLIIGPTIFDRVVALNGIGTLAPVLMVLTGMVYGRIDMFVDVAIAIYLLNLFTTLLIARYVRQKAETEE